MNKDEIIRDIEAKWKRGETAWIDVAWILNEVQWMRTALREQFPGEQPRWVRVILHDEGGEA